MPSPQITAKMKLDANGVKVGTAEVQKHFSAMGKRIRSEIGNALKQSLKVGAAAGIATVGLTLKKSLTDGLKQAFAVEGAETLMKSTLGGLDKAREAMALIGKEAAENPIFSKAELAEAGKSLSSFAGGNVKKLGELLETAEKLSVLKPEQGIAGAAFALKEALSGNFTSLVSRFDLDKASVNRFQQQGLHGKDVVDAVLRAQGITDQTLRDLAGTRQGQFMELQNRLADIGEQFYNAIWPELEPMLKETADWMKQNGQEVVAGLQVIAGATLKSAEYLAKLAGALNSTSADLANYAYGNSDSLGKAAWMRYVPYMNMGVSALDLRRQWDKSVNAAHDYNTMGSRTREAINAGQVQPAAAVNRAPAIQQSSMTINVTGTGVAAQMSNS